MEAVAKEAQEINRQCKTRCLVHDFSKKTHAEDYEALWAKLTDIDVSILINNVGYLAIGPLEQMSDEDLHNIITVNMYGMTLMSKMAVEVFKKRFAERRVRSLICSTDSIAASGPMPLVGAYSASKNYGNFISEGIYYELGHLGVDSLSCNPGGVATKMVGMAGKQKRSSCNFVTPQEHVIACLSKCTSGHTYGSWRHEI